MMSRLPPLTVYLAGDVDRENPWRAKVISECTDVPIVFYCPEETVKYSAQGLTQRHRFDRIFHSVDKHPGHWPHGIVKRVSET